MNINNICKLTESLNKKIGEGEFGNVFKAKMTYDKDIAVKTIKPSEDAEKDNTLKTEFNNEIKISNIICGNNCGTEFVSKTIGSCLDDTKEIPLVTDETNVNISGPFLFNEYYNGGSLSEIKESYDIINFREIITNIKDGLNYIHNKGYTHNDIACRNIFLHNGVPKIGDFGLANEIGKTFVNTKIPSYQMPPEYYKNIKKDDKGIIKSKYESQRESDIWQYGLLILELLKINDLRYKSDFKKIQNGWKDEIKDEIIKETGISGWINFYRKDEYSIKKFFYKTNIQEFDIFYLEALKFLKKDENKRQKLSTLQNGGNSPKSKNLDNDIFGKLITKINEPDKIFVKNYEINNLKYFKNEIDIREKINKKDHSLSSISSNLRDYIIFSGIRSYREKFILLKKCFECVIKLHNKDYTHNDIQLKNFYIDNDNKVLLGNLNLAVKKGSIYNFDIKSINYKGEFNQETKLIYDLNAFSLLILEIFYYKSYLTYILNKNYKILKEEEEKIPKKIKDNIQKLIKIFKEKNYKNIKSSFTELINQILDEKNNIIELNKKSINYKTKSLKTLFENEFSPKY